LSGVVRIHDTFTPAISGSFQPKYSSFWLLSAFVAQQYVAFLVIFNFLGNDASALLTTDGSRQRIILHLDEMT